MLSTETSGHRYFIELAFDGGRFHGWQVQPHSTTIQEVMTRGLSLLTGQTINLVGSGRTDTGVHASHFVAHFDLDEPGCDCRRLANRLNRFLPAEIRIDRIQEVGPGAHARFSATARTYYYIIMNGKNPFMIRYAWNLHVPLDTGRMNAAVPSITGTHDFTSFSKLHTDVKTNMCEVYEAGWTERDEFHIFRIKADRFLRNMVRALVGTFTEIGKGKLEPEEILNRLDRSEAGMSVPAHGLYLARVDYPEDVFMIDPKPPFLDLF
jgi:tRNA pseudouridine38-40 synthase